MIIAYIERNVPGLKMPRTEGERDEAGIRSEGEILSGRTSTRDAFIMEGKRLFQAGYRPWGGRGDVAQDPVLRFHRRLDEPEPSGDPRWPLGPPSRT
jgi:hypothetical protein